MDLLLLINCTYIPIHFLHLLNLRQDGQLVLLQNLDITFPQIEFVDGVSRRVEQGGVILLKLQLRGSARGGAEFAAHLLGFRSAVRPIKVEFPAQMGGFRLREGAKVAVYEGATPFEVDEAFVVEKVEYPLRHGLEAYSVGVKNHFQVL